MGDYVATYKGLPVFTANVGEEGVTSCEEFAQALREAIYNLRNIKTWIECWYDPFEMQTKIVVIQDKFITIDRMIVTHDEYGEQQYSFQSNKYLNKDAKEIAVFYIKINRFLSPMTDESYIELVNYILPEKKEEEKKEGKTLVALRCPSCGGAVNPETMTCDYCATKVVWR